jgi:lipopolysaccharide transport system permease protein
VTGLTSESSAQAGNDPVAPLGASSTDDVVSSPGLGMIVEGSIAERHRRTERIVPNPKVEGLGLEELWRYRELVFGLFHRDVMAIKNQTPTAWFWRLLQPTFTLITYTIMFEHIGKITAAMLPWSLFSAVLLGAVSSLASNAGFFSKVYFPRLILPLVSVTNAVVDFLLTGALLFAILLYMEMPLQWGLLFVPFLGFWALLLGLSLGLWLSALNVLYREISQGLPYVVQLAFFFSPVVYPTYLVPAQFQEYYHLNPLVGIIDGFQWAFFGKGAAPGSSEAMSFFLTCLFFLSGVWFFRRMERVFADII